MFLITILLLYDKPAHIFLHLSINNFLPALGAKGLIADEADSFNVFLHEKYDAKTPNIIAITTDKRIFSVYNLIPIPGSVYVPSYINIIYLGTNIEPIIEPNNEPTNVIIIGYSI